MKLQREVYKKLVMYEKKRGGQEKLKLKIYQKNSDRKFMNIFFFFLAHSTALPTDHWADVSTLAV